MSDGTTITVRIRKSMVRRLEAAASRACRSRSAVAAAAIEEFLEAQDWQVEAINEGIAFADRGNVVPHQNVKKWAGSLGAKRMPRRRPPRRRLP